MDSSIFFEIWGAIVVILLGSLGTYAWLRTAATAKERPFILRQSAFCWAMAVGMVAGVVYIPRPYGFLLWLPCGIVTPLMLQYWNRRREYVRGEGRRRRDEAFLRGDRGSGSVHDDGQG